MQVEIWSDVVCPWCYLGKRCFERALEGFEHRGAVEVRYRSFELDPAARAGVTVSAVDHLADKYGLSPAQAADAQQQMEHRAAADGLTFRLSGLRSGNTRDAHRLIHLARAHGLEPEMVEGLHRAYFTEQRSVFDHESLSAVGAEAGLDGTDVAAVLASDRYTQDVEREEAEAHALGATGVPFFVIDRRYGIAGAQPADVILDVVRQAWDAPVGLQPADRVR